MFLNVSMYTRQNLFSIKNSKSGRYGNSEICLQLFLYVLFLQEFRNACPNFRKLQKQSSRGVLFGRISFLIKLQASDLQFYYKMALAQVVFCEFCEMFKRTFFYRTPMMAASEINFIIMNAHSLKKSFSWNPQNRGFTEKVLWMSYFILSEFARGI